MEYLVEISQEQQMMAFVASCIESVARFLNADYAEVFKRMKRVGMIEQYILPYYDTLHTESRENLTKGLVECLNEWEERK